SAPSPPAPSSRASTPRPTTPPPSPSAGTGAPPLPTSCPSPPTASRSAGAGTWRAGTSPPGTPGSPTTTPRSAWSRSTARPPSTTGRRADRGRDPHALRHRPAGRARALAAQPGRGPPDDAPRRGRGHRQRRLRRRRGDHRRHRPRLPGPRRRAHRARHLPHRTHPPRPAHGALTMTTYAEFRAQYPDGEIPAHLLSAYDEARTTWALDLASAAEAAAIEADTATGPDALTRRAVAAQLPDHTGPHPILDAPMTPALR